jgi:signal transduction histidine kinase
MHGVLIDFSSEHHALSLQVSDNGRGFEIAAENDGHGLRSMARRALAMGGKLKVESRPGGGTTVQLKLPLPGANDI